VLYFTLFRIGREGFVLPAFKNAIKSVTHIDETGRRVPLQVKTGVDGRRTIAVPPMAVHDTMGSVVVVEIEGGKVER
jgi:hypothetical protein